MTKHEFALKFIAGFNFSESDYCPFEFSLKSLRDNKLCNANNLKYLDNCEKC